MLKRTLYATVLTALATVAVSVPAQAAQAAPGPCYPLERTTTSYWVWCNGTGPSSYRATAYCTNSKTYYGQWRWYGDRRGSTAVCQSGSRLWNYGVQGRA